MKKIHLVQCTNVHSSKDIKCSQLKCPEQLYLKKRNCTKIENLFSLGTYIFATINKFYTLGAGHNSFIMAVFLLDRPGGYQTTVKD